MTEVMKKEKSNFHPIFHKKAFSIEKLLTQKIQICLSSKIKLKSLPLL
jgi:hypothetical protein